MVKKGGNGSSRNKYNQRSNGGRPNGGGMNDYRNRSQMSSSNGLQQRQTNGGSYGSGVGQRSMSRFSNAPGGSSSAYQPRAYGNGIAGSSDSGSKSVYTPRQMNGSASAEQSKYAGYQAKPPTAMANVYGQQSHQTYPSVMATSSAASIYALPPPPFSSVSSALSFNYPPPVLPVKN